MIDHLSLNSTKFLIWLTHQIISVKQSLELLHISIGDFFSTKGESEVKQLRSREKSSAAAFLVQVLVWQYKYVLIYSSILNQNRPMDSSTLS